MLFGQHGKNDWLIECRDIESQAVEFFARVWPTVAARHNPLSREDDITLNLFGYAREAGFTRDIAPIEAFPTKVEKNPSGDYRVKGEYDLRVSLGNDPENVLVFECKRLNATSKSGKFYPLDDKYSQQGVIRFVTGQYADKMPIGAMLAYVMNGNATQATSAVVNRLGLDAVLLSLATKPPQVLPPINGHPRLCSQHNRMGNSTVEVRHTFLPI